MKPDFPRLVPQRSFSAGEKQRPAAGWWLLPFAGRLILAATALALAVEMIRNR